jgi:hypothetical protein
MKTRHLALLLGLLVAPTLIPPLLTMPAFAHEQRKGPNGGPMVDAGAYHIELLASGTTLEILVSDGDDKPLPATGFKAMAIMVVDGGTHRIALSPSADGKKLVGKSPVAMLTIKGAVQLTVPDGKIATGRIN